MTIGRHRHTTALLAFVTCGLLTVVGAASAGAGPERTTEPNARPASGAPPAAGPNALRLSIPRPTGRHPVGVRSTFVHDPARMELLTGRPRAIPVRIWYPAKRRHGRSAPYFSPTVQAFIEQALTVPAGLFDVDTHGTLDAPARRDVRGVLVFTGGFAVPAALYTALINELASRGYAVVTLDHPHETFVVEQPDGSLIANDLPDDAATFEARLRDIRIALETLKDLVPEARPRTPIGIFGHSNGGAAAAVAISRHPQISAGVNLDGFIPMELINAGLDRPFGLMLSLDQQAQELRDIELFLSNMRAPHPVRTLNIRHYGFTDFVVFNPQTQRANPVLGAAFETRFPTGTVRSLRAGRGALSQQRRFLGRFFDRHLGANRSSGDR